MPDTFPIPDGRDMRTSIETTRIRSSRPSKVFEWFGDEFAKDVPGQLAWIAKHVGPAEAALLKSGQLKVSYLGWDWALNKQ